MRKNKNGKNKVVTEGYLDTRLEKFGQGLKQELKEEISGEISDKIQGSTVKILQAVDKIATKFDAAEKDHAAHTVLHKRLTDDLHSYDQRIKKLETRVL